ncbi:MAG: aminoacyl-tRNA hydrolase [Planctomycetes bacterium]|nr:aminoacyl-tRNA hydrolase [Planctomycetota bacterium]
MIDVAPNIHVEESELEFSFARSGGPGGQHVNKTSSKVVLHWTVVESPGVPDAVKQRFLQQYRTRITEAGVLVLDCDETRSQHRNRELVVERLKGMLEAVAKPPKKRVPTRPGKGVKKRRRQAREKHAQKKQLRKKVDY